MPELSPANQAIEEIKAILAKHDLAGMVMVTAPKESAFLHHITPSWSCAFFEGGGTDRLRIKCKRKDYPSIEAQKKALEDTVGMVIAFHSEARRQEANIELVITALGKQFQITHREEMNEN